MAHELTLSGAQGVLKWGYHHAATLRAWSVTRGDAGWSLSATVEQADSFRLSQQPIVFAVTHAKGTWKWPVVELQIDGARLNAVLGQKE